MKPIVFIDMDGVLADFVWGFRELMDLSPQWECTDYDLEKASDIPWEIIKDCINGLGAFFWEDLPWIASGIRLLNDLEEAGYRCVVATDPANYVNSYQGKRAWLRKALPSHEKTAIFTGDKSSLAPGGAILIDDSRANCDAFRANGGTAYLVKTSYNPDGMECDAIRALIIAKPEPSISPTTRALIESFERP